MHQIPVGPVHAGIIEPGHFRFTANGETVVRLEERLGYVHKGIDALMAGAPLERAARLAGRVSGDSTVAYAMAFARGRGRARHRSPAARGLPARARRRARASRQPFGRYRRVCNDAAFGIMHAACGLLREQVLRTAFACFGHRLMMDCVVPGGMRADLAAGSEKQLASLLAFVAARFPELVELYDNTASLKDRTVGTGILTPALAQQFAAGGYVGRASGRQFDARRSPGYAPYEALNFEVPVVQAGDVNARVWIRIREVEQSLGLVEQLVERLPAGAVRGCAAGRRRQRRCARRRLPRRHLRLGAPRRRRPGRALSPARPVLVPVAAPGSGNRGQHRCRLPALQQVVQLLVFRP